MQPSHDSAFILEAELEEDMEMPLWRGESRLVRAAKSASGMSELSQ